MNPKPERSVDPRLLAALSTENPSTRLQAALTAGTHPAPALLGPLLARCAVEPDFYVRDMLTWALTRLPAARTVPALLAELESGPAQARSQALHTLSKIGDPATWSAITPELLRDPDDEVARSAWRAAVALVPDAERKALAAELAGQFARGGRDVQRSLSRALAALGDLIEPLLDTAKTSPDPAVRAHALVTEQLLRDPDAAFDIEAAKRIAALDGAPC
ncbi:HEAT repeat domain-containing protein [Nocardia asteroides]|uniref:HEAT repeat domain-containing protein n=1 Tax=Nocardia asteroides TaxID=1824 RepID=UPI001E4CF7B2|nr:HEAT repeat domain-containing protein [Nocardia asteroides]UGT61885.1 HEAT repeat domain-containing protein [Nocardia asteroides]